MVYENNEYLPYNNNEIEITINNENKGTKYLPVVENGGETDQSNENKDDQAADNNVSNDNMSESDQEMMNFMELLFEKHNARLCAKFDEQNVKMKEQNNELRGDINELKGEVKQHKEVAKKERR